MFWTIAFIICFALCLCLIYRSTRTQMLQKAEFEASLEQCARSVLGDVRKAQFETNGVFTFENEINGSTVQMRFICDTLAVRKLPTLWLSITLLKPTPLQGRFDVMCRPASVMSFSNFHQLPHVLDHPLNELLHMQLRSSCQHLPESVEESITAFAPLRDPHAKELILDDKGLRFVVHLGDGDRARYGVLRQAAFINPHLDPKKICHLIDALFASHHNLEPQKSRVLQSI